MSERCTKALLIPTDSNYVNYWSEFDDCIVTDPEDYTKETVIKNCREGDLIPGSIIVVRPTEESLKDNPKTKYWERVI